MKHFLLFLTSMFVFSTIQAQNSLIDNKKLNMATLIVDYQTYQFEGGHLDYYSRCPSCTNDSIPFDIDYDPPGDFGGITFSIQSTRDTIFDATIIWMGTGKLHYPDTFFKKDPFTNGNDLVSIPQSLEIYDLDGTKSTDPDKMKYADSIWSAVDSLKVTKAFSEYNYKAAIYLWPPTVGAFNPAVAKWVIFLYYQDQATATHCMCVDTSEMLIYPNPVEEVLTVNHYMIQPAEILITNMAGQELLRTTSSIPKGSTEMDVSHLRNGLYILTVKAEGGSNSKIFMKK